MLPHNIDINGKGGRLVTGVCDKAQKARKVLPILVIPCSTETRPLKCCDRTQSFHLSCNILG